MKGINTTNDQQKSLRQRIVDIKTTQITIAASATLVQHQACRSDVGLNLGRQPLSSGQGFCECEQVVKIPCRFNINLDDFNTNDTTSNYRYCAGSIKPPVAVATHRKSRHARHPGLSSQPPRSRCPGRSRHARYARVTWRPSRPRFTRRTTRPRLQEKQEPVSK